MSNDFILKMLEKYKIDCNMFLYIIEQTKHMSDREKEEWIKNFLIEVNR